MLITSYGIDSAILQIIYYHATDGRNDFLTMSGRNLSAYLKVNDVNIVADLGNFLPEKYIENNPKLVIIENKKIIAESFSNHKRLVYADKISKASLFVKAFRFQLKKGNRLLDVADALASYEESATTSTLYDLYNSLGHDMFVQRFMRNTDIELTSDEKKTVEAVYRYKEITAKHLIKEVSKKNGIAIIKADYSMQNFLAREFFTDGDSDNICLMCWNYSVDGCINIGIKSLGNLASEIAKMYGGSGYKGNGYMTDFVNFSHNNSIEDYINEKYVPKIINLIEEGPNSEVFRRDQEIIENRRNSNNNIDNIKYIENILEK